MLNPKYREAALEARDMAMKAGISASIGLHCENSHLMRIGNNSVSLNTSEELTRLDIEVICGRKLGTHTVLGETLDAAEILETVKMVALKAGNASEMDYLPVLPVIESDIDVEDQYDPDLDDLDPAVKEGVYSRIFQEAGSDLNYSGSWSSGSTETFLVSTGGPGSARLLLTDQQFSCVLKQPTAGWELADWQTGWKAGDVGAKAAVESFRNLLPVYTENPGHMVEPGPAKVLFGSQALGDLMRMAVYTGCSGRAWEMKMGWTSSRNIGDSILHPSVSIIDDPGSTGLFRNPVSDSGRPAERIPLVDRGVLAAMIYDRNTASKYGREATANAGCLTMLPGSGPADPLEAVKDLEEVLYIPAIHYMNLPNMSKGIFTGSSRFSAVLIRRGRIASPIFSSRITDSFEKVFGKVLAISSKQVSVNTSNTYGRRSPDAVFVPSWMLVDDIAITDCAESF